MATFALIHGGGSTAWDWHQVIPLLEAAGHRASAADLPIENDDAGLAEYAKAVAAAVARQAEDTTDDDGAPSDIIVVAHSLGGFTAPLACEKLKAKGLVYLTAMIPFPGEDFGDWWTNTGHDKESIDEDENVSFFNLVPGDLAIQAKARTRDQQGKWMSFPWPGERLPDIPTAGIVCLQDQFFPPDFMRRQIRERLGVDPTEIPGGHYAPLSHPREVAAALDAFARRISGEGD